MNKNIKKLLAILLAVIMTAALMSGCAGGGKTIYKVNGIPVSSGDYTFALLNAIWSVESSLSAKFETIADLTFGEGTVADMVKEYAYNDVTVLALVESILKEKGINWTKEDESLFYDYMNYYISQVGSKAQLKAQLQLGGSTLKAFENYIKGEIKKSKLELALHGEGGEREITDEQVRAAFDTDYARVKHILITTVDDNDQPLEGDALAAKDALYESLWARVSAGEDFDALMLEYTEDPGLETNPDGYFLSENSSFVEEFKTASLALAVGELGYCKSSFGHHILLRCPLGDEEYEEYKDDVLSEIKAADYQEYINEKYEAAEIETVNQNEIDRAYTKIILTRKAQAA